MRKIYFLVILGLVFSAYKLNSDVTKASWYGPGFHGKLTASGEVYNQYDYTAAHRTLPFGTQVIVTNVANNKRVIVTVNDRGPYKYFIHQDGKVRPVRPLQPHPDRDFDLSKQAFDSIADLEDGVISIKYEVFEWDNMDFKLADDDN